MRGLRAAHSILGDVERDDEFEPGLYPGYKYITPTGLGGHIAALRANDISPRWGWVK